MGHQKATALAGAPVPSWSAVARTHGGTGKKLLHAVRFSRDNVRSLSGLDERPKRKIQV